MTSPSDPREQSPADAAAAETHDLRLLQPLTAALLECVTPAEVASVVVERGLLVLGADAGQVALVRQDGTELEVVSAHGYSPENLAEWGRLPVSAPYPLSDVVRAGIPLYLESRDAWTQHYPHLADESEGNNAFTSSLFLPLATGRRVLGAIHFSFLQERQFSPTDRIFLEEFGRQCTLALERAQLLEEVETARSRQEFLARVTALLGESLDYQTRLEQLARLCVPELADWSAVDTLRADGTLDRLVVAHRLPERESLMREIQQRYPPMVHQGQNVLSVIQTNKPLFLPSITAEMVERGATDAEHFRLLQGVGLRAVLSLPLATRGRTLGALTLGMAPEPDGSGRSFTSDAVALAEEVAHRASVLLDNARLYHNALRAVEEARSATERQEHEQEQQGAPPPVTASEESFRLMVASVRDYAIFMLDPEGRIATWNAGAQRFKGYHADEIIGQHFSRFYTEEDIAARHPWHELEIAKREGRYEEEGWRIRKDGTRFWANVVITALRDEQGHLRGFGKVTRDMTERRERDLEQAAAKIAEQQRRFLKDVLASVTQGRLLLCDTRSDLPSPVFPQPAGAPIPLTRVSLKAVRTRVEEVAASYGMRRTRIQDIITAVSECAMNAVVHAGGGTARVYSDPARKTLQVFVEDQGKGIDLSSLPRATLERGFTTAGSLGHGFWLMLETCDRVYLLTGPSGTTVVLEQHSTPPQPAWLK